MVSSISSVDGVQSYPVHDFTDERVTLKDADFETAIKLCEYGRFHYKILLLCGMIFLCAGFQNGLNAFIIPAAECDLQLTSQQKGYLNAAFFVGGVSSSLVWGIFANVYGRKRILVGTLLVDAVLTFLSTLSPNFYTLAIFRGLSGFTIGAPGSLLYTYVGEFHASKQRMQSICLLGFFWISASVCLPGLAWIIIPSKVSFEFNGFLFNSWRLYLGTIGVPTFVLGLMLMLYPESPKYLLSRGHKEEALQILRQIYVINTKRLASEYPVKQLEVTDQEVFGSNLNSANDSRAESSSCWVLLSLLKNAREQIHALTSRPLVKYALLCWSINFTSLFGWYGLGIWMPELFKRFDNYYTQHPNVSTASVCELVKLNSTIVLEKFDCEHYTLNSNIFTKTLVINIICALSSVLCGYLSSRVGRRTIPVVTSMIAVLAGFAIYFVNSSTQIFIVACIFCIMMTSSNAVLNSVVVDIFPTYVNALAVCMMSFVGRLGAIASNLAFGILVDFSCEVLIFLVTGVILISALLSLFLPVAKKI